MRFILLILSVKIYIINISRNIISIILNLRFYRWDWTNWSIRTKSLKLNLISNWNILHILILFLTQLSIFKIFHFY